MPAYKHNNSLTTTNVPANGSLEQGEFAINITDKKAWVGDASGNPVLIVDYNASGGGATVTISDTAPSSPSNGDLWWDSVKGNLNIWYQDGTSDQWVSAGKGGGQTGPIVEELIDLTDVNTSTPTNRNVLVADGVDWESRALVEADISDFGDNNTSVTGNWDFSGDIVFTEKADHSSTPTAGKGYVWVKNTTPSTLIYTDDTGEDFELVGASVSISDTAPVSPKNGDLWWDSAKGILNIWYEDGTSNQWVSTSDGGGSGGGASELSDLTDVNTSTPTNRNVLVADGVDWESRALVEADISDLGSYITSAGVTYENLSANSDIGTGATQVAQGDHTHTGVYEPADADIAKTDVAETITANWDFSGDIVFTEKADHSSTPAIGKGYLWVKSDTPSSLIYTDDAGTDYDLTNYEVADATILKEADVDDTPVDAATTAPISSNWAYDHVNGADPHTVYPLDSEVLKKDGSVALTSNWDAGSFSITASALTADAGAISGAQDIVLTEQADHSSTPAAGFGYIWVKSDTPSTLIFTDDAGTDTDIINSYHPKGEIVAVNAQTGTTYTLVASDKGKIVQCTNASAITVSCNTGVHAVNDVIYILQNGAGQVTIGGSATVNVNSSFNKKTMGQYAMLTLTCIATNTFILSGMLEAV